LISKSAGIYLDHLTLSQSSPSQLAQNAVHGAMSGWTGFTIANVNDQTCYIPLSEIISSKRQIEENDRTWQRLLASTGQPSFLNDEDYAVEANLVHPN